VTIGERLRARPLLLAAGVAGLALLGSALVILSMIWLVAFPRQRLAAAAVSSLTVRDAAGAILRQQVSGSGGRQSLVPLSRMAPALMAATLAAEDHRFFAHHGVDPRGVLRAAWLNLRARRFAYGGSTLTMQLVRLVDPEPRSARARGLVGKLGEAVAAARLERLLGKRQILEHYLNRVYYGNGVWGAEAAARFYLGKPAAQLSVGEAAFLAVLPRSPRRYDPFRNGLKVTLERRRHILRRMQALGSITAGERQLAEQTPLGSLRRERPDFAAPHLVEHALAQVPAAIEVTTTVDQPLQRRVEVAVREHLHTVGGRDISQAGVVVLRNRDGALLAMVGSGDYFDPRRSGAVNVTTLRRRPGSTLKPFVYGLALEAGDTPATLALDVILPGEARAPYAVDVRQHGLGRYREALAGSYNLAAVHTLSRVGVGALLDRLRLAGLTTLDWPPHRYSLHLAIGDAEVTLLQLTAAFAAFGNGGQAVVPRVVLQARAADGRDLTPPVGSGQAIFATAVAYQVFDMLADPDARRPMFGQDTPTHLPFPVAFKTGTTRAYTDNLALGTTREYTVGAWAGNFDGRPTEGVMAMMGAAPLVRAAFVALAARFAPPTAPERPPGLADAMICPLSGQAPGLACPHRKRELFAVAHLPDPHHPCDMHQRQDGRSVVVYPEAVHPWARAMGLLRQREQRSPVASPPGPLRILFPAAGARFSLDPYRPPAQQIPPLQASPPGPTRWTVDGEPIARWRPTPGLHLVRAERAGQTDQVTVQFD
jgi:penicillin-binding protein 1C